MPDMFRPLQRRTLEPPSPDLRLNQSFYQDVAVNILGFIPAGFFFAAYLLGKPGRKRMAVYLTVALLGAGLSLLIELTQAWLPTRDSSLIDVACNAAGTVLGILLHNALRRKD